MNNNAIEELKKYGRIINEEIKMDKIDPIIGREEEIRRIIEILSRKKKNNPVLVGEAGVGKTAIVEGLVQKIENKDVPNNLIGMQIFELDIANLIAGTKFQGEFEKRLKTVTNIIKEKNNFLIFIDELHVVVGAGRTQGALDASNILKPMLARGEIKCIGATTNDEYRQYIEKDNALERRFSKILVFEPTPEETLTILRGLKSRFEAFHEIAIKDKALVMATKLAKQYITLRNFPDKAIDLIDEACAKIKTDISSVPSELDKINSNIIQLTIEKNALQKEEDKDFITKEKLEMVEKQLTKLVVIQKKLTNKWKAEKEVIKKIVDNQKKLLEAKKQLNLVMQQGDYNQAGEIKYQIIPKLEQEVNKWKKNNQEKNNYLLKNTVDENDIAKIVSNWTKIPVNKLVADKEKKILNLLKNLQEFIKGQDEALKLVADILLLAQTNLNESTKPLASFLFVGGTGVGKTLIAKVLANILFSSEKKLFQFDMSEFNDKHTISKLIGAPPGYIGYERGGALTEMVKNNPYSVILFDEIEKAHPEVQALLLQLLEEGRLTDSLGKTISFTNTIVIMTSNLGGELIGTKNYNAQKVLAKVKNSLTNEFLNRIDEIIVFNPLNLFVYGQIVDLEMDKFLEKIKNEKNILFQYDNQFRNKIIKESYEVIYGARPIKRYLRHNIANMIANKIIKKEIKENIVYLLSLKNDKFCIEKQILI